MPTSEPLHVAFIWHMHQPYYRSARTGAFEMPWARMHALKDYLDMVEMLADYPSLHHTFNLVPSLVEQLEDYASGHFADVYWEHTLKPAAELDPAERAFVVERMCDRSDHPRARSHPRYLELARKKEAQASHSWEACADAFTVDEIRDLQVWFNLAWFDPRALAVDPLRELVARDQGFREEDKGALAQVQAEILARTLPAYQDAARRGQIELSTSPYFHPILPLLANSDSARIASPDIVLPPRRFAHPEDAIEQIRSAIAKHERVFGELPRGMWCSEQAVGEDVVPLLIDAGLKWTISDETVLARSLSGAAPRWKVPADAGAAGTGTNGLSSELVHTPYRLKRGAGEIAIIFRDHTLSDLIGFAYQSWNSRDAANNLLQRLRDLRSTLLSGETGGRRIPLVTIALDGENAWEYYPQDGRDFLQFLYEGLAADPSLRCVSVSEHLQESPAAPSLDWLHTGSWIGGDLRTWSGDRAQNGAWDLLHQARDLAARRRPLPSGATELDPQHAAASHHIMVAEGSDWFWWFGDHQSTELDHVWDLNFRLHLQEVYRSLGEPIPLELFLPLLERAPAVCPVLPRGMIAPVIDGSAADFDAWEAAGFLVPDLPSTMQRAQATKIDAVRFGWSTGRRLCLLVVPGPLSTLRGLEIEIRVTRSGTEDGPIVRITLEQEGGVEVSCVCGLHLAGPVEAAWRDVLEIALPLDALPTTIEEQVGLVVHIGRDGMTEHVYHSAGLASIGGEGP